MNDNVRGLPAKDDPLRAELEKLKRNLPILLEMAPVLARLKRATYLALIESGFTAEQAFLMVKDK